MPETNEPEQIPDPTPEQREALKNLVRGIVLAQGNIFIKELLRQKKDIKIGATKADFERNMLAAIDEGKLRQSDVDAWLDEVEGWGNQYVYLYKVPVDLSKDPRLSDASALEKMLNKAGLGHLWNKQTSFEFPDALQLTGISFDGSSIRFVWHQGLSSWVKDESKDSLCPAREIDGDWYEFRAYRRRAERSVMRFELSSTLKLAAVFIEPPWGESEHQKLLEQVANAVAPLLRFDMLTKYPIASSIKKLDYAGMSGASLAKQVKTQDARLSHGATWVEFATTSKVGDYKSDLTIKGIRAAATSSLPLTGARGTFYFQPQSPKGLQRLVKFQLYGRNRRIRLLAQMTAPEVWQVLNLL